MKRLVVIGSLCLYFVLTDQCNGEVKPNDPLFERQVGFVNPGGGVSFDIFNRRPSKRTFECVKGIDLNITEAWSITMGSKEVVVAILDDGFFYHHEDIKDNIWHNSGESGVDANGYRKETNGKDDDGNGYKDDVMGWDFAFDDPDPDAYIFDGKDNTKVQPYWHSISAMGIIGAKGNNGIGVAGINWNVSMMLLKMCAQGTWPKEKFNRSKKAAQAIRYAADNGARIINWSGFVSQHDPDDLATLEAAIEYARDRNVLLVLGAGNYATNTDLKENYIYPQCFDSDNILNVAEIDLAGKLDRNSGRHRVSGSCYGERTVDIAAIARNYTTDVYNGWSTYDLGGGTSCAAPVVAGVAALVLSVMPELDYRQLKEILMRTSRKLPALEGKVGCGGMIDAGAAVKAAVAAR